MAIKIRFILGLLLLSTSYSIAQEQYDRSGLNFSVGIGTGFSAHAASYSVEKTGGLGQVDEYGGYRILSGDLGLGWGFTPRIQAMYFLKYTPANTTISPYKSLYHGLTINYSPKSLAELILGAGAGFNQAKDKKEFIADGILVNLLVAYEFNPHFMVELNTLFGSMENTPPALSNLDNSSEFGMYLTLKYVFYKSAE